MNGLEIFIIEIEGVRPRQERNTYTLQAIGTQVLDLLVACVPNISDLAGLVALVQTDTQLVSETHGCYFSICKSKGKRRGSGQYKGLRLCLGCVK